MSTYQVDYSALVTALQDNRQEEANRLLRPLLPKLKKYLMVVMGAAGDDAEEAVHQAFFNVYQKIMSDEIKHDQYIYKYLLKSCRHAYLHMMQRRMEEITGMDEHDNQVSPARQIENLLDKDRQRILKSCIGELPEKARAYIRYIFSNPGATTKALSEYFDISESNVRVKKTRIIRRLSKCVKKKWNT